MTTNATDENIWITLEDGSSLWLPKRLADQLRPEDVIRWKAPKNDEDWSSYEEHSVPMSPTGDGTATLLVEDLEEKLAKETDPTRIDMIKQLVEEAKLSAYDDFASEYDCPKMELEARLEQLGFQDLIGHMYHGRYN